MIPTRRLRKWSINTKRSHNNRGLELHANSQTIYKQAVKVLLENNGTCPECGKLITFNRDHGGNGGLDWISLEYNNPDSFEIICIGCNQRRNAEQQRKGVNYFNSK